MKLNTKIIGQEGYNKPPPYLFSSLLIVNLMTNRWRLKCRSLQVIYTLSTVADIIGILCIRLIDKILLTNINYPHY